MFGLNVTLPCNNLTTNGVVLDSVVPTPPILYSSSISYRYFPLKLLVTEFGMCNVILLSSATEVLFTNLNIARGVEVVVNTGLSFIRT